MNSFLEKRKKKKKQFNSNNKLNHSVSGNTSTPTCQQQFHKVERSQHRAYENIILTITKRFAHVSPPTEQRNIHPKGDEPANDFHARSRPWNKINGLSLCFFLFFLPCRSLHRYSPVRVKAWRAASHRLESKLGQIRGGGRCLIERRKKAERIVSCVDVSHHRMRVCLPRFRPQRWPKLIAMLVASPVPGIWKRNHILCLPLSPIGSLSSPPFNESHCTIRTLLNHGLTCFYYSFAWRVSKLEIR